MSESSMGTSDREGTLRGVTIIVLTGVLLGAAYNYLGLKSRPSWGLAWIAEPRDEGLLEIEAVPTSPGEVSDDPLAPVAYAGSDDPLAPVASANLPVIPATDRPVKLGLAALKQLTDADAVFLIDAREPDEFALGHIPGAINLPYDQAITDPELLESLDTAGRPIVIYCGGGGCEVSLGLAEELLYAGHDRVAYYTGGYPEWAEAGYPAETVAAEGM